MNEREREQVGAFLRQGEWFGGLPAALQKLILSRAILRSFAKGQMVQREDSTSPGLIAIVEGQVTLLRYVGDGDQAILHAAGPGFWFGQLSVLMDDPAVSGIAQSAVKALVLPKFEFDRIIADEPGYYPAFAQPVFERFRTLVRYFAETTLLIPDVRLRLRLADLAETRRVDTQATGEAVVLDLTQADLAGMLGLSRQRVNRHLQVLEKEGLIHLAPRRIRVLDPLALRASAVGEFRAQPEPGYPARRAPSVPSRARG